MTNNCSNTLIYYRFPEMDRSSKYTLDIRRYYNIFYMSKKIKIKHSKNIVFENL